ncbi:hypothetical protein ACFE04_023608 [Oxalis oulophora]
MWDLRGDKGSEVYQTLKSGKSLPTSSSARNKPQYFYSKTILSVAKRSWENLTEFLLSVIDNKKLTIYMCLLFHLLSEVSVIMKITIFGKLQWTLTVPTNYQYLLRFIKFISVVLLTEFIYTPPLFPDRPILPSASVIGHNLTVLALVASEVHVASQWQEAAFDDMSLKLDANTAALRKEVVDWRVEVQRLASFSDIHGDLPPGETSRSLQERNRDLEEERSFQNDDRVHKAFLEILKMYLKEHKDINEVVILFEDHSNLFDEFTRILSEASGAQAANNAPFAWNSNQRYTERSRGAPTLRKMPANKIKQKRKSMASLSISNVFNCPKPKLCHGILTPRCSFPPSSVRFSRTRQWNKAVVCAAASAAGSSNSDSELNPYDVLGVSQFEGFDKVKAKYTKRRKEAEKNGDQATVARLEKAYDKLMMSQLTNRKQGVTLGSFKVSKDIKYADKQPIVPWGPRFTKSNDFDMRINLAISAAFTAWIAIKRYAEYKPLQFLVFAFVYRIFEKLKSYEPPVSPTLTEEGEDNGRGLRMGKRLLRSLGIAFGCVAFCSLAYTGILNAIEMIGGYIPVVLYNNQELVVTTSSAVMLFIMASYYR